MAVRAFYRFNEQDDNGEVIIRDSTGKKIDSLTFNKHSFSKVVGYLKSKYGFRVNPNDLKDEIAEGKKWLDLDNNFFSD